MAKDGRLYLPDPTTDALIYIGNPLAPANGSLWFLANLMVVSVCTPLILWLTRRWGGAVVWVMGVLWFALGYTELDLTYQLVKAFFFYTFGAYMSISGKDMLVEFGRYRVWAAVLYPLLAVAHMGAAYWCPALCLPLKQANILVGLVFAYNAAEYLLRRGLVRVVPFLASASFFVYVTNSLLTTGRVLKILLLIFSPSSGVGYTLVYALTVVVIVGLLLGVYYLLRRYCPSLLRVLTGRR